MPTSARNMGKNDVWIAATASVLQIPLLTTDADFQHLDTVYLELHQCQA
jgi:tRNA(fMet)-specific endonuclease VapC